MYKAWQKHDRAVPLFEDAIGRFERRWGPDNPLVLGAKVGLSGSYLELGRHAETRMLLEPLIDRIRHVLGEWEFATHVAFYNIACARANLGDAEGAYRYLRESIDRGWNYHVSLSRDQLLLSLRGDPRFDAIERAGRLNERSRWDFFCFEAQSRMSDGRLADAERLLRGLIAAIERVDRNGAGGRAVLPRLTLARCWILRGRFDDAARLLLPTLSAVRAGGGVHDAGKPLPEELERKTLQLLAQCDIGRERRDSALARIAEADTLAGPLGGFENVERYYHEAQTKSLRGLDDEALRSLARAAEMGLEDVEQLEHDLAFARLRNRAEFRAIVKAVRGRAL